MLADGSFESGKWTSWTRNTSYTVANVTSGWNGVQAADGNRYVAISGPASVGYSYARVVYQSFFPSVTESTGTTRTDNMLFYLDAYVYLHTNDGRQVSYTLGMEPGYGAAVTSFHGAGQDAWVQANTWGYYYKKDPFEPTSTDKALTVYIELRDPLQSGEYLLIDDVNLYYGGVGVPEPVTSLALLGGVACIGLRRRVR